MKEAEARAEAQPRPKKEGAVSDPLFFRAEDSSRGRVIDPALLSSRRNLGVERSALNVERSSFRPRPRPPFPPFRLS